MAGETKICHACGSVIVRVKQSRRQWSQTKHCSADCKYMRAVQRVMNGESRMHRDGYRLLYLPMHPSSGTYVYEHRVIAERKLGRLLASHEYVHHVNEDKLDNRPENLEVLGGSAHQIRHRSGIPDTEVARLIQEGVTCTRIAALGVATHRIVRVRRQMKASEVSAMD